MKATLTGTPGEDREGGVAIDAAGNVYEALAAEGPVDGQANAGAKDVVLIKYGPTGTKLWTKEFGTAGVDRAVRPAARPAGPSGHRRLHEGQPRRQPRRQHERRRLRDEGRPERQPRVDDAGRQPDGRRPRLRPRDRRATGSIYVAGYTKGVLAGARTSATRTSSCSRVAPTGGAPTWIQPVRHGRRGQGHGGRRRRRRRLRRRHGHRLARHAAAGHDAGRRRRLPRPLRRRAARATLDAPARHDRPTSSCGASPPTRPATRPSPASRPAISSRRTPGDKDIVVARFDPAGAMTLHDQLGTIGNDKGASVALDGAGNTYVSGVQRRQLRDEHRQLRRAC